MYQVSLKRLLYIILFPVSGFSILISLLIMMQSGKYTFKSIYGFGLLFVMLYSVALGGKMLLYIGSQIKVVLVATFNPKNGYTSEAKEEWKKLITYILLLILSLATFIGVIGAYN